MVFEQSVTKPTLHLYHTPGACSRVILNAIEEIGDPYEETCIALARGDQRKPAYLSINPKGKVPVLVDGDVIVTESPAILYHLATTRPEPRLLPVGEDGRPSLDSLSDMIWIAGAIHPATTRLFRPELTSTADAEGVRQGAAAQLRQYAEAVSRRYTDQQWYYGEAWSIVDFYFAWVFGLAANYGFPIDEFARLSDLRNRAEARPSFERARKVEIAAAEREQLPMPPGFKL